VSAGVPGFDAVAGLWEDGLSRLRELDEGERRKVESVVELLTLELRRRVGVGFTTDELARYYLQEGTDWCFEVAIRLAPETPAAWDMTTVAGAAFGRYLRFASDYGGGRRMEQEE
jgi:hypothetical protein